MPKLNGAGILVETLRSEGVRYVFGVPGGQTLYISDYMYDLDGIQFAATRHEGAAATAADGWGRLTGVPGVCLATTGPGATNLLTGIGGALRDSSPVLILTCNNRRKDVGRGDAQEADHVAIFRPLVKWGAYVDDIRALPERVREAFRMALTGRPGPVHLDLARDVLENEELEYEALAPSRYRVADRRPGDPEQVAQAAALLTAAERPVIWAGNGVKLSRAAGDVMALAEALDIPVVTTFNGIGAVPSSHDLVFGPRSRSGTRLTTGILEESDCVLVVGSTLTGPTTSRWGLKLPENLIQIDLDATNIGRHYPVRVGIPGDAALVLRQLLAASAGAAPSGARTRWTAELRRRRSAWKADVFRAEYSADSPVRPVYLMQELSRALSPDAIITVDAGNPGIWSHLLELEPSHTYMKPVNFGNMGFALPAGIAAALAEPDREVVVLIGDGSLGMTLAELETAVRLRTRMTIVLMNDLAYGNIKQEQLHYHGPRYIGVDFIDIDFVKIMEACGGRGERADRGDQIAGALERARASALPYLIDVRIDGRDNVWKQPF